MLGNLSIDLHYQILMSKQQAKTPEFSLCRNCANRGDEVYEMVYKCKLRPDAVYGSHSVKCDKFKNRIL
jgi:hypothetical protein